MTEQCLLLQLEIYLQWKQQGCITRSMVIFVVIASVVTVMAVSIDTSILVHSIHQPQASRP